MGSSKSLRLLATAYNFEERKIAFGLLKPSKDTRESPDLIYSRAGMNRECTPVDGDTNLFTLIKDYKEIVTNLKFILIDEAQFLSAHQVDELGKVVDELNVNVYCYGLRTDFRTQLFEGSKRLFEIADEFEEIESMCTCGNKTSVNARYNEDGEMVVDGDQILIGGDDTYKSICRHCYQEELNVKRNF